VLTQLQLCLRTLKKAIKQTSIFSVVHRRFFLVQYRLQQLLLCFLLLPKVWRWLELAEEK
jgi:hypothetical protein